jgi:DNA-binding winged helix-turn-helix (wHTH) protein/tetratricopeptide (TPR) repeat protein
MSKESKHFFEFGPFRIDPGERQLWRGQDPIPLTPKAFETLLILIRSSEHVVLKDDLMKALWPDSFVEESNLTQNIFVLRKALGDSAQDALYIATVPGRGYRFAQKVTQVAAGEDVLVVQSRSIQTVTIEETVSEPRRLPAGVQFSSSWKPRKWILVSGAVAGLVVLALIAAHRLRRPPALNDTDLVLVSDFVNTTGEPIFDSTLKQAVGVQLAESPYFNLASDSTTRQTLRLMNRPTDQRVVPPIAREVCQREGAKVMIAGSILAVGNTYELGLDAVNCSTGTSLAREEIEARDKDEVLKKLGQVIPPLRRKLGESISSIQKFDRPIEQATTKSLSALKAYTTGEEKRALGQDPESIQFYQMAIDLDPDFAMAYARLGTIYLNLSQPALAAEYWRKAMERRDHTTDREKFYIVTHATPETDKIIENYKLWSQVYPNDWIPFNNLANQYDIAGSLNESLEAAQHALRLNPNNSFPYEGLARAYQRSSRFAEAKAVCEKAKEKNLGGWALHEMLWKFAFMDGDEPGMQRELDWQKGKGVEALMLTYEGETFLSFGQVSKSREIIERARSAALQHDQKETAASITTTQALDEADLGDYEHTSAWGDFALHTAPDAPEVRIGAALALARSGNLGRAESLAKGADQASASAPDAVTMACLRAAFDLGRHNPAAAIADLENVARYDLGVTLAGVAMYYRGLAYLELKSGKEAAAQFQKIIDNRGAAWFYWPLAHLGLARAYALTGNNEDSLAAYREFLSLCKNADPDLRLLRESKNEYTKLQRRAEQSR